MDFTKMRKGSKPRGRTISVCAKCGRKGEYSRKTYKKTGSTFDEWIHSGHQVSIFFMVDDHCTVKVENAA